MNPIVLILLIGIGGVFAVSAANAANTGDKSSIKLLNVDSVKVIGTEIELTASIAIDNPTANPISIKKPYLKMFFSGSEVGNSLPSGEYVLVKGNARTVINNVNLRIPILSVPTIASALFQNKESGATIKLEVHTVVSGFAVKDAKEFKISDLVGLIKK